MYEELIELLFGQGRRPLRRGLKLHVAMDDKGTPQIEIAGGETVGLSQEDAIEHIELTRDRFHSGCRCSTNVEVGGQCNLCDRAVCVACWTRCAMCLTGLCPGCLIRIPTESGSKDLCPACDDLVRWRSLISKTSLGLLQPPRF